MEKALPETYNIFLEVKVHEDEAPVEKVVKLALMIKDSNNVVAKLKFDYEVKILELKIRLQPGTPPKVREQRQRDLNITLKGIYDMMADYGKLLDDVMHIWTSLQEDPNVLKIEEELHAK